MQKAAARYPEIVADIRSLIGPKGGMLAVRGTQDWFASRLRDGTVGYYQRRADDCLTAGLASLTGIPPHRVPDLRLARREQAGQPTDRIELETDQLLAAWEAEHGLRIRYRAVSPTTGRYLAVLDSGVPNNDHVAVMNGRDLIFDPARLWADGDGPLSGYSRDHVSYAITIERG